MVEYSPSGSSRCDCGWPFVVLHIVVIASFEFSTRDFTFTIHVLYVHYLVVPTNNKR